LNADPKPRHGGRIRADALVAQGPKPAFGVPGETYLPVLDGLHDVREQLAFIVCRQEGGASYMAEAYGKLTGEPGVLFVTRGPGATNGAIGVHTGFQDSTPMVVFIGQVPNEFAEREAFQEIDYRRMYGQMAKWVGQIDRVERIPEYVSRAFHTALAGRPGPVVLALPEDTLFSQAAVADAPRHHVVRPAPSSAEMAEVHRLLENARTPFVLLGGGGWPRRGGKGVLRVDRAAPDAGQGPVRRDHPLVIGLPAGGHDRGRRRRQLRRLAAPAFPLQGLSHATRLDQWLDGLWLPGGGRRQAGGAEAHGFRAVRGWRLPDDGPGARDCRAVRRQLRHRGREQRLVRHDPHAPGARVPGTRLRHRAEEPGLRGLCARLRRPRRDRGAHR